MQRMLVGLVLFLTVVVAVLGVSTYNLYEEVDSRPRGRQDSVAMRPTAEDRQQAARVESLEGRIEDLLSQVATLKRDQVRLRAALADGSRHPGSDPSPGTDEPGRDDGGNPSPGFWTDPQRDPDGGFRISEQEEEYFLAVQKRVQRRQRIDGMTRNVMRRIERLAGSGEIGPILEESRPRVERVIKKYVVMGDDLITHYIREPTDEINAMSAEEKRDTMRAARETMVVQAQEELAPVLGVDDALKVAERTLQGYWGGRLNRGDRRSTGGRR